MGTNVGLNDRIMRIFGGAMLLMLATAGIGTPFTWIGIIPLGTGALAWCPAYLPFGFSTCKKKS
jgi:hypothetical protein